MLPLVTPLSVAAAAPTDAEITAAQRAADEAAAQVTALLTEEGAVQGTLDGAEAAAAAALARYEAEQARLADVRADAERARAAADGAEAAVEAARTDLAAFARSSYIDGTASAGMWKLFPSPDSTCGSGASHRPGSTSSVPFASYASTSGIQHAIATCGVSDGRRETSLVS